MFDTLFYNILENTRKDFGDTPPMSIKPHETERFIQIKCKNCGANLKTDTSIVKCEYCKSVYENTKIEKF